MIVGPGKELDMKDGFKLDPGAGFGRIKEGQAWDMDIWAALDRFFALDRVNSTNHLDEKLTQLARDVDIKRYGIESVVRALVDHDFRLFETVLVSRGLGQNIRTFLSQPCAASAGTLPQPHFNILQQLCATISALEGAQKVPEDILRLGEIIEAAGTVLVALATFGRKEVPTKSNKARIQHPKNPSMSEDESLYHNLGVSPPKSINDVSKTADILCRRLSNIMKAYLEYCVTRAASNFLRNRFVQCFNAGDVSRSVRRPNELAPQHTTRSAPGDVLSFLGDTVGPGRWLIVLAQRALRNLRQLSTRHQVLYSIFVQKIDELSGGHFSTANHARVLSNKYNIPIFKAELLNGIYIIYQIDCGGPAEDPSKESQFIRVYDIDTIYKKFWRDVADQLHIRDPEYCRRCNARSTPQQKLSISGGIWPLLFDRESTGTSASAAQSPDAQGVRSKDAQPSKTSREQSKSTESFLELHRVLSLEKFIPYSKDLIASLQKDGDGTFMFSMSSAERDVINHSSSCLVLGRSGTGKTTTMMFKMLAYELSAHHAGIPCRQLFVTQSPALAEKVKAYYETLKHNSLDLAPNQEAEEQAAPSFTLDDMDVQKRKDGAAAPNSWSKLCDDDFPLFLSYDEASTLLHTVNLKLKCSVQFCNLLAQDLGQRYEPEHPTRLSYSILSESSKIKRGKITFEVFMARIWPHLGSERNGIDPLLFFNEIIGVIEGSEAALASESGFLDRSSYLSLQGATGQKIFIGRRDLVYDLFQKYLRYKPKGSWDSAERSHALIKALFLKYGSRPPDPHIDFIYIDEVQDNLLLDTALLRWLCPNPDGLFFAGDTAQTVSAGSNFRFNDLKEFLYRLERQDEQVANRKRKAVDPTFFSLSVNYRSHAGIIKLAAFLITTLSRLFSGSIDDLAEEHALVAGPKPTFFLARGQKTPFSTFISSDSNAQLHFGADQVIIVRDEVAQKRLREKIDPRHASMVMTIYSSKGQEFNDVLLHDFFADSQASPDDWEALLEACNPTRAMDFETFERHHAILQAELKCLYVGITRAREHVWVWDSSSRGDAFQSLMEKQGLAEVTHPKDDPPPMAVRSTKRQWALRGKDCFQRGDYVNASLAFERAHLLWWKAVADGFEHKRLAELMSIRDSSRLPSLKSVGDQISNCASHASTVNDRTRLLEISTDCYLEAKAYKLAADQLYELQRYEEAAWNYRLAGSFRKAVAIVQEHREEVSTKLVEDIKDVAAVVFSRQGETEMAKSLFETPDAHVEFLEENGFCDQRVSVLVDLARHEAAADALVQQGRRSEAVTCFLESKGKNAQSRAVQCLVDGLFEQVTFAMDLKQSSDELSKLLDLTSRVRGTALQRLEMDAVKAIHSCDLAQLREYGEQYPEVYPHLSLLCLDSYLASTSKKPFGNDAENMTNVIHTLRTYVLYGRLIRTVAQFPDLVWRDNLQRIFGLSVKASSSTEGNTSALTGIVVLPHSFVHPQAVDEISSGRGVKTDNGILLPPETVSQKVCQALLSRYNGLAGTLLDTLDTVKNNSPFTLCFQHLDQGCKTVPCKRYHLTKAELSIQGFNQRMEMHLLIVAAMECLNRSPGNRAERRFLQELWLQRLFETCYPLDGRLGNISWVKPSLILRYDSLISAAKVWCEDLYRIMGRKGNYFLTNAIGCAMFSSAFDYLNAIHYIPRAEWANARSKSEAHLHMEKALCWFHRNAQDRHYYGITFIKFTKARSWDGVMRALTGFAEVAASDPLLRITKKVQPEAKVWASGLRTFQWTSAKDLLSEFGFFESGLARLPSKNERKVATGNPLQSNIGGPNPPKDAGLSKETGDLLPVQRTHEEAHAAEKILQCYRRYRHRLGGGLGGPLWEAYNDRANLLASSPASRLYKIHLRVAMPQVLTYVRHIISCIENVNDQMNKRAASVPHEELDVIRAQAKAVRKVLRDAKAVATIIGPDSSFHDTLSLGALKGEVKEVITLRERAAVIHPSLNDPDANYQEAVDFLVPPDPRPKSKILPLLNTDDVYSGPNGVLA
ncbi:hypothetical protein FRC04_009298 [Tulasnella sp. 424]|nr:hypothetical protein FRC04_009298 [Tulasnella sp. 424]KAG8973116.1 hypothetical protein FRC05_009126 [Tulasnella sp. 425]